MAHHEGIENSYSKYSDSSLYIAKSSHWSQYHILTMAKCAEAAAQK